MAEKIDTVRVLWAIPKLTLVTGEDAHQRQRHWCHEGEGEPTFKPTTSWSEGLPRRSTELGLTETQCSRVPGTLDYCFRTETTQNKMMSGIFLPLATIHMFVQGKKVGARRHECLLLKKSLFVSTTVERLFWAFILKVQLPQQQDQGHNSSGACQHSCFFSTKCERVAWVTAQWRTGTYWLGKAFWVDKTILFDTFHCLVQWCLRDTSTYSR